MTGLQHTKEIYSVDLHGVLSQWKGKQKSGTEEKTLIHFLFTTSTE